MHKKLTISIDEKVYNGLYQKIGKRKISNFIENLVKPHVLKEDLEAGYKLMAVDELREQEALEWSENLIEDTINETR